MSKLAKFLVTLTSGEQVVADTAKEVSGLLGRKVTRTQIISCMVPEVQLLDDTNTNEDKVENKDEVALDNIPQDVIDQVDQILNEGSELKTSDINTIEDYVGEHTEEEDSQEEGDEESVLCSRCDKEILPSEDKYVQDDETILCEDCNHAKNMEQDTPGSSNGMTKMEALMARMREINAKKNAQGSTTTTKGKKSKATDAIKYLEENNGYPEVGYFKEEKDLKKFYKQLDDTQLDEWLEIEGLTYKASDNEPINRMRKCMAILYCHFPRESKTTTKSKSKYADYSTEELLQMAIDNDIYVQEGKGDPRILRMYCIMELKKAGLLE